MLYIISTPIGNLEDISIRAIITLFSVDVLLCEDTRRAGQLLKTLQERHPNLLPQKKMQPILQSYYDEVELKRLPEIIQLLEENREVGLVSDSGTPIISDPGYLLVRECRKRNITVVSIPGASAVLTALTTSGLPTDSFYFAGFLPEKDGHRKKRLVELQSILQTTIVLYCSPHKLLTTLKDIAEIYGEVFEITLARELTKIHEELWTGTIKEALTKKPQGEYVLLWRNG